MCVYTVRICTIPNRILWLTRHKTDTQEYEQCRRSNMQAAKILHEGPTPYHTKIGKYTLRVYASDTKETHTKHVYNNESNSWVYTRVEVARMYSTVRRSTFLTLHKKNIVTRLYNILRTNIARQFCAPLLPCTFAVV